MIILIEAGRLDVSWTMQYGMGSCFHCSAGVQSRNDINTNTGNNNTPNLEQCPRASSLFNFRVSF